MRKLILLMPVLAACASKAPPVVEAPAAPAEAHIQVCVIDTIAPGGMMTIGAIHMLETNDTVVIQPEGRVRIAQLVAGPKVLSEATWLGAKKPIVLAAASGRRSYAMSGAAKAHEPGKLALLAMMRGVPVFAAPAEGGAMRAELESFAARGIDLEKALQQRPRLRQQLDRVRTLYVPTALTGCEFQAFTAPARRRR